NEFDRGNVTQAQKILEAAFAKSPDLIEDKDFLRQVDRIETDGKADGASNLLTTLLEEKMRRIKDPDDRAETAFMFSSLISNRKQFDKAVQILSENLPEQAKRTPTQNNQIAYMRALAGTDLELALSEIDAAIEVQENDSFLDTKGWVLHRLGRNDEALEVMDKALAKLTEAWSADSVLSMCLTKMNELQSQAGDQASDKPKGWGLDALLE
ncbi:MAG: tetratricopeptide repeat protein, partial [Pirellula sp.]